MELQFPTTITTTGTSKCIVIPKVICDNFGLEKGEHLWLILNDEGIKIPLMVNQYMLKKTEMERNEKI